MSEGIVMRLMRCWRESDIVIERQHQIGLDVALTFAKNRPKIGIVTMRLYLNGQSNVRANSSDNIGI
jgi:hypothetical protein